MQFKRRLNKFCLAELWRFVTSLFSGAVYKLFYLLTYLLQELTTPIEGQTGFFSKSETSNYTTHGKI